MKTVARGVELLDERLPGWDEEITVENLNLSNCRECVLGQLFGEYDKGLRVLGLSSKDAKSLGFYRWPGPSRWESLSKAWRDIVRSRRA